MAYNMSVDQVSTVLKSVLSQAMGGADIAATDVNQLLSIGTTQLTTARDPLMSALSQVLSSTIFSARPYQRKFSSMWNRPEAWGNWVRKVCAVDDDNDLTDDLFLPLTDGAAIDQWTVRKPKAVQINFTDQKSYCFMKTIPENQLNTAFSSADEFSRFIGMIMVYMNNKIEKTHEETARATLAGFVGGKLVGDSTNVIHLVTEYNALKGTQLTSTTVFQPANWEDFARWAFARIDVISKMMTEYSINFHTNLTLGNITRHTPVSEQRLYLYNDYLTQIETNVLTTFIDPYLKFGADVERVNYWQSIDTPDTIKQVKPKFLTASGSIGEASDDLSQAHVFGVLMDREACGYSPVFERSVATPVNARGLYHNLYWHFLERNNIDFTENGVVFLLD